MRLSDFDYPLPPELIAQTPPDVRGASRLLCVGGPAGQHTALADRSFTELPSLLEPGDLLVFNDTRVIKARLFGSKASGGRVEVLVERVLSDDRALVHLRASKSPRPGMGLSRPVGERRRVLPRAATPCAGIQRHASLH